MDKYLKMFEPAMKKWLSEHYSPEEAKARWERTAALDEKWIREEGDLGGKKNPMASNMLEAGDAIVSASFVYSFESISGHFGKYPDWVQHPTVGNYHGLKQVRFYYASNETLAFAVPSFRKIMEE